MYCFLLFCCLASFALTAQVGVNNNNPEQALDVNGKIKLTDDATAPSAGTLRYNSAEVTFEGYNGTEWKSFTERRSHRLAANPIPLFGSVPGVPKSGSREFSFNTWTDALSFTTPPPGKFIIITAIFFQPNAIDKNADFEFSMGVSARPNINNSSSLFFLINTTNNRPILSETAPIFVVSPGETLKMFLEPTSSIDFANANVRGFLVDDLEF